jgi:hypothetical protein
MLSWRDSMYIQYIEQWGRTTRKVQQVRPEEHKDVGRGAMSCHVLRQLTQSRGVLIDRRPLPQTLHIATEFKCWYSCCHFGTKLAMKENLDPWRLDHLTLTQRRVPAPSKETPHHRKTYLNPLEPPGPRTGLEALDNMMLLVLRGTELRIV